MAPRRDLRYRLQLATTVQDQDLCNEMKIERPEERLEALNGAHSGESLVQRTYEVPLQQLSLGQLRNLLKHKIRTNAVASAVQPDDGAVAAAAMAGNGLREIADDIEANSNGSTGYSGSQGGDDDSTVVQEDCELGQAEAQDASFDDNAPMGDEAVHAEFEQRSSEEMRNSPEACLIHISSTRSGEGVSVDDMNITPGSILSSSSSSSLRVPASLAQVDLMRSNLNRQLEELKVDADSAMLPAATMEASVPLQESDIVDLSRRGMFKYALRDIESLQSLLNPDVLLDESALVQEIDGILGNWRLLFPSGGLTGGLEQFMSVLEQLVPELRGDGIQDVERTLREKTTAIEKTVQEFLKNLERFDACSREQRNSPTVLVQKSERRIKELQASLVEEKKHCEAMSNQLTEVNRNLSYTSSVSEEISHLRPQVDLQVALYCLRETEAHHDFVPPISFFLKLLKQA